MNDNKGDYNDSPVVIDGSMGEGGGQILRTALSLSLLTGKPFRITRIRAGRSKPGIMPQHLAAIRAATKISQAKIEGAEIGSQSLTFSPEILRAGKYHFDIETAGSTSLVLQTILLPLSMAGGPSQVSITGGTHVSWSPSFHYLEFHWLPYIQAMGTKIRLKLIKAGYYPHGGGKVEASIRPISKLHPLQLHERGSLLRIRGISAVSNLNMEIAVRQKHQALRRLESVCNDTRIKSLEISSIGKGTFLLLLAEFQSSRACYCSLGVKGKRAERVADEACDSLISLLSGSGAVDEFLADQLLLPMSLSQEKSQISTPLITGHLISNAQIIQKFLRVQIKIEGENDQPGFVVVSPLL